MPTIYQLPTATVVSASDLLPISQSGQTRSVSVATLLSGTQTIISLPQNALLGRVSAGSGGPEVVSLSTGVALQNGGLIATAQDHTSLPQATVLQVTDELVINSSAQPKRVVASNIRSLFSAGSGVMIDQNGVISATGSGTGVGAVGPQGPAGPAGQGLNFRGAWQASTTYSAYDVVVNSGQTYFVNSSFTSGSTFSGSNLTLMAAEGAVGPQGLQGAAGSQGPAGPTTPATPTSVGAVKPGAGLVIASDGTLSIGSVALATIAQSGAVTGQVLGWTGTGWGPTSGAASGVQTFNGRSGTITLSVNDLTTVLGTGSTARVNLALATVASSGSYADLTGVPAIPAASTSAPSADGAASAGMASTFARGDHVHPTDTTRLSVANNLSDLANAATARTNLGLGTSAIQNVGTIAGTVAAGNDSRLVGALQASAIPAGANALLGGTGTLGAATIISLGSGLSLSNGTLTAAGAALSPATTTTLGGVKPDGTTVVAASDGTLSVVGVSPASLPDVGTAGGPALTDIAAINRSGTAYKVTLAEQVALVRKTPAGSRIVTLSSSATTATLTATDHDKTVVIAGSAAGTLTSDGTPTEGFRAQVINHTGSAISFASITGLGGTTQLPDSASCFVSFANGKLEASAPVSSSGSSNYVLPPASNSALGGVKTDGTTIIAASDGTISAVSVSAGSFPDVSTAGGPTLSDSSILARGSTNYKVTLSESSTFFRKTPAGSRAITLTQSATTATITSTDNDKIVVVTGTGPGMLASDGTPTDGFCCRVINHSGAALGLSGITGLQAVTSIPNGASAVVTLSNATLEASTSAASIAAATTSTIGAVKPDGTTITVASDGTISVPGVSLTSLTDISSLGGPALTDIDQINRAGVDYKATVAERLTLFRQTPAGSRAAALSSGSTSVVLLPSDNDRVVVVTGTAGGTLTTNSAIPDGFQCQVINSTSSPLTFSSPLIGLGGATTLPSSASCWVTSANGTVEAFVPQASAAGSNNQLQINSNGGFGAVSVGSGLTISNGILSAGASYTLPPASNSVLGGVIVGPGIAVTANGTISVPAYFTFGVSGVVNSLPGGAGAIVYRYVFVRPCSLPSNLVTPYAPQGLAGTPPTNGASFSLSKLSAGVVTNIGTITFAPSGALSAATSQIPFAAGDELIVSSPNPTDNTLADVSVTFTGTWG